MDWGKCDKYMLHSRVLEYLINQVKHLSFHLVNGNQTWYWEENINKSMHIHETFLHLLWKIWRRWMARGRSGSLCSSSCPLDLYSDKQKLLDGWMNFWLMSSNLLVLLQRGCMRSTFRSAALLWMCWRQNKCRKTNRNLVSKVEIQLLLAWQFWTAR